MAHEKRIQFSSTLRNGGSRLAYTMTMESCRDLASVYTASESNLGITRATSLVAHGDVANALRVSSIIQLISKQMKLGGQIDVLWEVIY